MEAEEIPSFFKAAMAEKNEMERDFLLLLLYTGARKSNVLVMAWKNVNLDLRIWVIPVVESKNGVSYTVPLVSLALEIIERRKREAGTSPGYSQSIPRRTFSGTPEGMGAIAENIRSGRFTTARFARTLGTWMLGTGSNEMTVAYALGHKLASQSVTAVYRGTDTGGDGNGGMGDAPQGRSDTGRGKRYPVQSERVSRSLKAFESP